MSIAIVQSQSTSGSGTSTTISATFGSTPVAPHQILVVVSGVVGSGTKPTWTISDSKGNTYTQAFHASLAAIDGGNEGETIDFWVLDPTASQVGSGFQVTATADIACFPNLVILELSYAGSPPTAGANGSASAGGVNGTTFSCGSLTIPSNSAVFALATQLSNSSAINPASGYTSVYAVNYVSGTTIGALLEALLNTTASPATPTATIGAAANNWGMAGLALTENPIAATGPTSGTVGTPSTNFTITPSAAITDTFTPSVSTITGTFTPSSLSWSNSGVAKTFTFTPSSAGTGSISGAFGNGYTVGGLPISFTASAPSGPTTATLTGPSSGATGIQTAAYTVTLNAAAGSGGVVVTPASDIGGDVFQATQGGGNVSTIAIPQGQSTGTFYLTGPSSGVRHVSITTSPALTYSGSPITLTLTSHTATAYSLSGPTTGLVNATSGPFTVALNGLPTGILTVIVTPSGGGLAEPIALTFSGNTTVQTFTLNPTAATTVTLTPSNNGGISNPSAVYYVVTAVPATWQRWSIVYNFPSGLSTVTYSVIADDGSTYSGPFAMGSGTGQIVALGGGAYGAWVTLPTSGGYTIKWSAGTAPDRQTAEGVSSYNLLNSGNQGSGLLLVDPDAGTVILT